MILRSLNPCCTQILSKHKNEIRGIKQILRETRACRNHLAKQLQTTEHKLLHTKANLQHLEVLSRDRHLWEREKLSVRLNEATTELQEKQRRISVLEYKVAVKGSHVQNYCCNLYFLNCFPDSREESRVVPSFVQPATCH